MLCKNALWFYDRFSAGNPDRNCIVKSRVFLFIIYYQYSSIYDKIEKLSVLK